MLSITKEFTFDAAHRLVKGYEGKCSNVHGHTYKVLITVSLREDRDHIEIVTLNEFDFVEDFDLLKMVKNWVDNNWDHASLVSKHDVEWINWLTLNKQKFFVFELGNPTVELICTFLLQRANDMLANNRVIVSKMEVYETQTSKATWEM